MTSPAFFRVGVAPRQLPPIWLITLAFASLVMAAAWATGQEAQPAKPLSKQFLAGVHTGTANLLTEVEHLQDAVAREPAAQKDRGLYKLTETTLAAVARFERGMKSEASPDRLLAGFDALDSQVRKLIAAARKDAPDGSALQRAADHVDQAHEELYYMLAGGDSKRAGKVTERQARAFTDATRDLQRTAKYALADSRTDRAVLIDNAAHLVLAAERFEKGLQNKAELKQRQSEFGDVDKAWARVVQGLALLKPAENVHLLRSAARVDRLHERMYRLLEIKGKRPSLSVQS